MEKVFNAKVKLIGTYEDLDDVENALDYNRDKLQELKEKLLMHSIGGVAAAKKVDNYKNTLDAVDYIHEQVSSLIDEMTSLSYEICKLQLLRKDFLENRR